MRAYWLISLLVAANGAVAAEWQCDNGVPVQLEAGKASDDRAELSGVLLGNGVVFALSNEALGHDGRQYAIQMFEGDVTSGYRLARDVELFEADEGACKGADFEGLTRRGANFFAVTSHSANREKQDKSDTRESNARRLSRAGVSTCDSRDQLIKFTMGDRPQVTVVQQTSLRDFINGSPVLSPFAGLPAKENGIDIEGIAATETELFVGFRGPVLRENYVPVLRLPQDLTRANVMGGKIVFVNLGGRGIRDLAPAADEDGLYVLAGPNGDEDQTFAIYQWDGESQIGGNGENGKKPKLLCDLGLQGDDKRKSKPEGIALLDGTKDRLRFLIVYDGNAPLRAEVRTLSKDGAIR